MYSHAKETCRVDLHSLKLLNQQPRHFNQNGDIPVTHKVSLLPSSACRQSCCSLGSRTRKGPAFKVHLIDFICFRDPMATTLRSLTGHKYIQSTCTHPVRTARCQRRWQRSFQTSAIGTKIPDFGFAFEYGYLQCRCENAITANRL